MNVLEINNVCKTLGKRKIIKGIDISVKEGEIFGFLGPNGAGKTTTIRMLVGLITQTSGDITICGHNLIKDKERALKDVGAVVENPELYKYLSGRENLMQIARIRKVSKKEVEELIKLVGLEGRIDDRVGKYSLGMKQRLGLAAALIGNPKLLILDEPTNGLDPSGILDFRAVIKQAAKEKGMAVFISSHILSEVQNLCDRVAFINQGVIQSTEEIQGQNIDTKKDSMTLITNTDKNKVLGIIKNIPYIIHSTLEGKEIHILLEKNMIPKLVKKLINEDVEVCEIYRNRRGLEERYMELMEGGIK
ncbi:ABC transporter ATP-binding protein [Clostridium uliginosum]|uniref:ABC-2 type transport system ATP-binding protein n=1 Tax=Clostridium uliginosum TaxID=119641 RepID=A0A1I1PDS3_9CLOT|nr:ABC transporter ATP-binding protein [Clostridium uliginosum]SFD05748.1 ABC-2 type transport system ATP-binding protein [Clostridium uliginosum]